MIKKIAIFAYAFPHRKTHDFLIELAALGCKEVVVLAAPWKKITEIPAKQIPQKVIQMPSPIETRIICERLGFSYYEIAHNEHELIRKIAENENLGLAIISGARILTTEVIDCFSEGVINFHPGALPQTSGLDAFYYTIKNNADLGVTAHFIDSRVDAGHRILFERTLVNTADTVEIVQHNNYLSQLVALRKVIGLISSKNISLEIINRPRKNEPMTDEEKVEVLARFEDWKIGKYIEMLKNKLFLACEIGSIEEVEYVLNLQPFLLEERNSRGWTPLIVAAFNQHFDLIKVLLKLGADVNATGRNGTTVLMYAKTALLNKESSNYDLVDYLLSSGADLSRCDKYGRTILDYVEQAGDWIMLKKLKSSSNS